MGALIAAKFKPSDSEGIRLDELPSLPFWNHPVRSIRLDESPIVANLKSPGSQSTPLDKHPSLGIGDVEGVQARRGPERTKSTHIW